MGRKKSKRGAAPQVLNGGLDMQKLGIPKHKRLQLLLEEKILQGAYRPGEKLPTEKELMQEYNYINEFEYVEDGRGGQYRVGLNGTINNCGVIKPRRPIKRRDLEKFEARYLPAQDFGVLILTTTRGVISNAKAKELGVGGKLLGYVF